MHHKVLADLHFAKYYPVADRSPASVEREAGSKTLSDFPPLGYYLSEMQPKSDAQLLRDYAERGAEAAFTELVQRHTNLVYSAALRQIELPDIAAEITQNVFVGLARGAKTLAPNLNAGASLAGWLYRSARNLSLNHRRDEFRRQTRERLAMEQILTPPDAATDWEKLRPVLDDAMSELNETDYDAVVLRFFQNQDFCAVGAAIGVSHDAAQKRVSRALEKLREHLSKRKVTTTASALALVVSANAVQAAPTGLAITISTAALAGTAVSTATVVAATTKTIAMTTLQKTLVTATVAVLAGAGIYEARQAAQLRDQVQSLQQQQAPLAEQNRQLQLEQSEATNQLSALSDELAKTKTNNLELLRLRSEVGLLRKQTNLLAGLQQPRATNSTATASANNPSEDKTSQELILRENYEFAGYTTPPSAIKSLFWAATRADPQAVLASMSPALKAQTEAEWANKSEEELKSELQKDNNSVSGYRVTDTLAVSDNEVVLSIYLEGRNRTNKMRMVRVGDEWKIAGKPGR